MGSRASYVIRKDGEARAYGSHWGASSLMDDLFWGPDYATKNFEAQARLDELADIDGGDEGCALIDWDQKRLLWSMANCELPVQQRLYNRLLAETWPGWSVASATRGIDDLLNHLGIPADRSDDNGEEEEPDDEEDREEALDFDEDLVYEPKSVASPVTELEDLEPGNWLTIREADGSLRDYFGFPDELDDCLCAGEAVIDRLQQFPALEAPPAELVTTGGAIIDRRERAVRRWEGPRYAWQERSIRRAWPGWSLQDLPGGWQAHLRATEREAANLAGGERQILGATVAGLLNDSTIDSRAAVAGLAALGRRLRLGCAGITAAVALAGGGLGWWLDSRTLLVLTGVVFAICLAATVWFWRRTSPTLSILAMTSAFPRDAPRPQGLTIEEKRRILDRVLVRLNYPSTDELERAGELPNEFWPDDEEEDE